MLLLLALAFGESLPTILQLFPTPVLGAVLFLAGAQLAAGPREWGRGRAERFVMIVTTALAIWNAGAACVFGVIAMFVIDRLRISSA